MSIFPFGPRAGLRAVLCLLLLGAFSAISAVADPVPVPDPIPIGKPPIYPDWWFERGVIPRLDPAEASPEWPDDYRPVNDRAAFNQGQLKTLATAAFDELEVKLSAAGGAGPDVTDLIKGWFKLDAQDNFLLDPVTNARIPKDTGVDNYAAVNLGQLKAVAQPFYDRLIELKFCHLHPWFLSSKPADDFSLANLGQAKNLFRFTSLTPIPTYPLALPDWYKGATGLDGSDSGDDGSGNSGDVDSGNSGENSSIIPTAGMGVGPFGGPVSDDGVDPDEIEDGITLLTRTVDYSFTKGETAFREFITDEGAIPNYYLEIKQKMTSGMASKTHPQSNTISSGSSQRFEPSTRSWSQSAFNMVTTFDVPSGEPVKTSYRDSHTAWADLPDRRDFLWKEHYTNSSVGGDTDIMNWVGQPISTGTPFRWSGFQPGLWAGYQSKTGSQSSSNDFLDGAEYPALPPPGSTAAPLGASVTATSAKLSLNQDDEAVTSHFDYIQTLGSVYGDANFIQDTINNRPEYPRPWVKANLAAAPIVGSYALSADKDSLTIKQTSYKFEGKGERPQQINIIEAFAPIDDTSTPADESKLIKLHLRTVPLEQNPGSVKTTSVEIKPSMANGPGVYKLYPVEIVDLVKRPLTKLHIGKMVDGSTLSTPPSPPPLIIDDENQRFFVRIAGGAELRIALGAASVEIGTTENGEVGFFGYADDLTKVSLTAEGPDLITKSMMLVSEQWDDNYEVDGIPDNDPEDRTHKVPLGGKVQFRTLKIGNTTLALNLDLQVPVFKTVKVRFFNCIYGLAGFKGQAFTTADADGQRRRIKERFAQCGIRADVTVQPGPDLGSGGGMDTITFTGSGTSTTLSLPAELKNLFGGVSLASDEIGIFGVGSFNGFAAGSKGQTAVRKYMSSADKALGYADKCLVSETSANPQTSAHELLHVLLNAIHDEYPVTHADPFQLWAETIWFGKITDSKRISNQMEEEMLGLHGFPAKSHYPQ